MSFDRCVQLGNHDHSHNRNKIQNISITAKHYLTPPLQSVPCLHFQLLATPDLISAPVVLPFPEGQMNGIIQYEAREVWLLALSIMLL